MKGELKPMKVIKELCDVLNALIFLKLLSPKTRTLES